MKRNGTKNTKKAAKIALQDIFIAAYLANLFNVTRACQATGVGRTTFYRWVNVDDTGFNEKLDVAREERLDFVENALMERINKGDTIAIIFALKCLGKNRGYTEEQRHRITAETLNISKEHRDAVMDAVIKSEMFVREIEIAAAKPLLEYDQGDDEA